MSYWNVDITDGRLSQDFSNLLDTDVNHDVELKCEEHTVKAHKIVLCARSEVLKAMLGTDMQEARTSVVLMKDIDVNNLRLFVRYLYTDELPDLTFDQAEILYDYGDKYAVKSLMHRCTEYFQKNLSPENISHCFALAEAHSDQHLMDAIKAYILERKLFSQYGFWVRLFEDYPEIFKEMQRMFTEQRKGMR